MFYGLVLKTANVLSQDVSLQPFSQEDIRRSFFFRFNCMCPGVRIFRLFSIRSFCILLVYLIDSILSSQDTRDTQRKVLGKHSDICLFPWQIKGDSNCTSVYRSVLLTCSALHETWQGSCLSSITYPPFSFCIVHDQRSAKTSSSLYVAQQTKRIVRSTSMLNDFSPSLALP